MKKKYFVDRAGQCTRTNHSLVLHKILTSLEGMNFSTLSSLNSIESNQPLRDLLQITTSMLTRFWLLRKNSLTPTTPHPPRC